MRDSKATRTTLGLNIYMGEIEFEEKIDGNVAYMERC